jgi:restriction endonuclease S subunit
MTKKLAELGEIRTGFQLREATKHDEGGANPVIQLGDVREDGIDVAALLRMDLERAREKDFVAAGDVLLRSRGASYRGAIVPDVSSGTVAAAPLYVLRLAHPGVLPEYVVWYVNQPGPQAVLAAAACGTHIPSVSRQAFAELEIVLPPVEEQRRIAEVDRLLREERGLTLALLDRRERLFQELLLKSVQRFADRKN